MKRNTWQLFSNDLDLAEKTLQTARSSPGSFRETASLAQHLTFFGHFDQAQDLLLNSPAAVLRETYGRAALFRIRQYRRHPNPWLSLCLREDKPLFETLCHRIKTSDITIQVKLGGGLGDMLETIAALHANSTDLKERVQLVVPGHAQAALIPLLECDQSAHRLAWTTTSGTATTAHKTALLRLPMMVFKAALARTQQVVAPKAIRTLENCSGSKPRLLACWRPKVDPDEKLWAHLRGLNMTRILQLYKVLMPIAHEQGFEVVDLTRYSDWEKRELLNNHPKGLNLIANKLCSFLNTIDYMGPNTLITSIDTSLIHLACWCGLQPVMLTHRWPDGRWLEGSWSDVVILEQTTLFDWDDPIKRLLERVKNHHWT